MQELFCGWQLNIFLLSVEKTSAYKPSNPSGQRPTLIPSFSSVNWLGVYLLPLGWDASPLQGYPALNLPVPIYISGWKEAL